MHNKLLTTNQPCCLPVASFVGLLELCVLSNLCALIRHVRRKMQHTTASLLSNGRGAWLFFHAPEFNRRPIGLADISRMLDVFHLLPQPLPSHTRPLPHQAHGAPGLLFMGLLSACKLRQSSPPRFFLVSCKIILSSFLSQLMRAPTKIFPPFAVSLSFVSTISMGSAFST